MVGRGWGHGIGMSQWGAYGYAKHGSTYEKILKHYYTGIGLGKVDERRSSASACAAACSAVKLTCADAYVASATTKRLDIPAGVTAVVTWVGRRVQGDRRHAGADVRRAGHLRTR